MTPANKTRGNTIMWLDSLQYAINISLKYIAKDRIYELVRLF